MGNQFLTVVPMVTIDELREIVERKGYVLLGVKRFKHKDRIYVAKRNPKTGSFVKITLYLRTHIEEIPREKFEELFK